MSTVREIQLRDEVKHISQDCQGIVIAKYPAMIDKTKMRVDVRDTADKVHYYSPIENWITVAKVEDLE